MKDDGGLTEKKMANKKFKKTEEAIFIAYFESQDFPNIKTIARRANISRSTLYRHHKIAQNIPQDYEKYLLQKYTQKIDKILFQKEISLRTIFGQTLIFISVNKRIFIGLFAVGHKEVINEMLEKLKKRIIIEWKISGNLEKIFHIYENEVLGAIEIWGEKGFSEEKLEVILKDVMYLTRTAPQKLLPLKD